MNIKNCILSTKKEIRTFLEDLNHIISSKSFDVNRDFLFVMSNKKEKQFSTQKTIIDLEYDTNDVIKTLQGLTVENYSETLFDRDDRNPPYLYVFGKYIKNKLVYIKIKIKIKNGGNVIVCVSFHYAQYEMHFPYLNGSRRRK